MKHVKKSLLIGTAAITSGMIGLTAAGIASAANTQVGKESIISKIADKLHLSTDQVKNVLSEYRKDEQSLRQNRRLDELAAAVADGKLTQEQANYIKNAWHNISSAEDALRSSNGDKTELRQKLRDLKNSLKTWEQQQNLNVGNILKVESSKVKS